MNLEYVTFGSFQDILSACKFEHIRMYDYEERIMMKRYSDDGSSNIHCTRCCTAHSRVFGIYDVVSTSLRGILCCGLALESTLQREVYTSSTWDGGCIEPLIHSQHGAIVKMLGS